MSNKYKVKVNDNFEFDVDSNDVSKIDASKISNNLFHVLDNNKSHKINIIKTDFYNKKYTLEVNNNKYDVAINDELDLLIKKMGLNKSSNQIVNELKAPMPGIVLNIEVKVGDTVKEDENLLVLEAMKMENMLTAPKDVVIKEIHVKKGDTVEKNKILIEFES